MKLILAIACAIAILYIIAVLVVFLLQNKMIFPGTRLDENHEFKRLSGVREKYVDVDGARLNALHFENKNPRGLIFFLHGNAGNLDTWMPDTDIYEHVNYDVFMIDYRGYGKSTGKISNQAELEHDVLHAWESVANDYKKRSLPIVIYGRSLGTYLATNLARSTKADLLVLVSPYTSVRSLAKKSFPWIPEWVLRFPMATDAIIDQVEMPIVLIHGSNDRLIPALHSHQLSQINKNSLMTIIDGAAHNDIQNFEAYNRTLANALP